MKEMTGDKSANKWKKWRLYECKEMTGDECKEMTGDMSAKKGLVVCDNLSMKKLIQKTYQFINVVNGVSHSHKTANIFISFDSVA